MRHKRFYSIEEAEKLISNQSLRISKLSKTSGINRTSILKELKKQITLCTSLGIVFMEYSFFSNSLRLLQTAVASEKNLLNEGTIMDTLWEGRPVLYNALAFLYQKAGQFKDGLQYVYRAHKLSLEFKDAGGSPSADILLASNMTSFIILWKIQKFKEASTYLETCASIVNEIYNQGQHSKLSVSSVKNLYGLVVMGLSGLLVKIERRYETAIEMCEDAMSQLDSNSIVKRLVESFVGQLKPTSKVQSVTQSSLDVQSNYSENSKPPELYEHRKPKNDWLITCLLYTSDAADE